MAGPAHLIRWAVEALKLLAVLALMLTLAITVLVLITLLFALEAMVLFRIAW